MGWVIVSCNMIYQEFFIKNFSQPTVTKYRNHHIYLSIQILCRHSLQRLWFFFASIDSFYKGYTNMFSYFCLSISFLIIFIATWFWIRFGGKINIKYSWKYTFPSIIGVVMLHPVIYDYIDGVVSPHVNFASLNAFLISFHLSLHHFHRICVMFLIEHLKIFKPFR